MEKTRAVGFLKPYIRLDNHLILWCQIIIWSFDVSIQHHKSCYIQHHKSCYIQHHKSCYIQHHKSCYIKYTINPTGTSDKNQNDKKDESKYLIDEVLEKFNRILSINIIRKKEAFFLHHVLGYLRKLCGDYVTELIFTSQFKMRTRFTSSRKFIIVHSSTVNPCEHNV